MTTACHVCGQTTYEPSVPTQHGETHEGTVTILRRYRDGGLLALFPGDAQAAGLRFPMVPSFAHIGQHSRADYDLVVRQTKPATLNDEDVQDLLTELRSLGYNPLVRRRFTRPW